MLEDDYAVADDKEVLDAEGAVVRRRRGRRSRGFLWGAGEESDLGEVEARTRSREIITV